MTRGAYLRRQTANARGAPCGSESVRLAVTMPGEMFLRLRSCAKDFDHSLSGQVVEYIRDGLDIDGYGPPKAEATE